MTAPIQGATFQHVECEGDHPPPPQNLPGARPEPCPGDSKLTKYPAHGAIQTTHSLAGSPLRDDSSPGPLAHTQPDLSRTPLPGAALSSCSSRPGPVLPSKFPPQGGAGSWVTPMAPPLRPMAPPQPGPQMVTTPHPHGCGQPHLLAPAQTGHFQLCCGPRQCKAIRLPMGRCGPHCS